MRELNHPTILARFALRRERGENPASTLFPKLAMAMGKPLDVSFYERALGKKKTKTMKVKKRKVRVKEN